MSTKLQAANSSVCLDWSQGPLLPGPLPCWVSIPPPFFLPQFPGPSGLLLFLLVLPLLPSNPICSHSSTSFSFSVLTEPTAASLVPSMPGICVPPAILITQPLLLLFFSPSILWKSCSRCLVCVLLVKLPVALHGLQAEANISPWDLKGIISLSQPPFKTMFLAA